MNAAENIYDFNEFGPLLQDKGLVEEPIGDGEGKEKRKYLKTQSRPHLRATKEEYENLYNKQNLTLNEIAKIYNVNSITILNQLKKYNIQRRKCNEKVQEINQKIKINIPKNELEEYCSNPKFLIIELGKLYGVSHITISRRIKEYNIDCSKLLEFSKNKKNNNIARTAKNIKIMQEKTRGSNNPNWTGKRNLKFAIRKCAKYKKWHAEVLKRDNFICQICKVRGGDLQVDHIKPFFVIIKENNVDTFEKADMCIELWDINNGRAICESCHRQTDTWAHKALNYRSEQK